MCVALAGASGALLGLAFVAISFNLDDIIADKALPGRAVETPGVGLTMLAVIATVATITTSIGGLYWLGGAMALATAVGLANSWVLLVEIKR